MSDIQFTSAKNYMKRAYSDSTSMPGPSVDKAFFFISTYVVPHNLGSATPYRAFYEPFRDGRIFEALQDAQAYFSDPINTYGGAATAPVLLAEITDSALTFTLNFQDGSLSALNFPIYWVIYGDYALNG